MRIFVSTAAVGADCDRLSLVRPILGLYGELYANHLRKKRDKNPQQEQPTRIGAVQASSDVLLNMPMMPEDDLMVSTQPLHAALRIELSRMWSLV